MLRIEKSALIVIDVQGKLAQLMFDKEELFGNLKKIIQGAKALSIPIIWLEQLPDKLGRTTPEIAELLEGLSPIEKSSFSCCDNENFSNTLTKLQRDQLLLTGIETHICVYQTAMDLMKLGSEVHVLIDAVSSRKIENKGIGLEKIKNGGGMLTSVETVLFELLKTAEHKDFGKIVKIVK